ncbi:MAG: FtsX-like permease family protein [Acidimicrobiales bacterium]
MLASTRTGQLAVSTDGPGLARVAAIDGVAAVASYGAVQLYPLALADRTDVIVAPSFATEGSFGYEVDRINLRTGRLPDPDEPFEAMATRQMVEALHLHVGDRVEVVAISGNDDEPFVLDGRESVELTIVGTGAFPPDVVPVTYLDDAARFFLTPALLDLVDGEDRHSGAAGVLLRRGVEPRSVLRDLQDAVGGDGFVDDRSDDVRSVEQALRPQVSALWVFAALAGIASMLAVAQVLTRQVQASASDNATLRALGMRRRDLVLLACVRGSLLGAGAAVLAVAVAIAASPIFPIGPARWAEPDPGVHVDGVVVGAGAAGVLAAVTLTIAAAAVFVAFARRSRPARQGHLLSTLASWLPGPAALVGVGFAVRPGRGERAAGWSAVFGVTSATAAFLLAATFGAGLDRLLESPDRYGQDWTFMVDTQFGAAPVGRMAVELGDDPAVEALAGGHYGDIVVEGQTIPAVGFTDLAGTTFPTIVQGRAPARDDELTMGASTMAALGVGVGDEVAVDTGDGERPMTIVGRVVLPRLSHGTFTSLGLGSGAVLRASAYPFVDVEDLFGGDLPDDVVADLSVDRVAYPFATVRMSADASAEETERVQELLAEAEAFLRTEQQPAAVANYGRVRSTSSGLTLTLAVLATASFASALVSSVRRHSRDLAVLKVLGLRRRQVRGVVAAQASALAGLSLVVGIPAGVVAGRLAWRWFADDLGVVPDPVVPVGLAVLVAPVTVLLANAIGAVPAWRAARTRAAVSLRAE